MKKIFAALSLLLTGGFLLAHDMFLKRDSFFLPANQDTEITLLNGTFEKSENSISRDRMTDVSIIGPMHERVHPDTAAWVAENNATVLRFTTGDSGTYVIGVSTTPSLIELSAEDFNSYLEHDGVLDVLDARREDGILNKGAREKYSKHVKALVQVGSRQSRGFGAKLEYPIEIVPLKNPYELTVGDRLEFGVYRHGKPVANQLVYASYDGFRAHDSENGHEEAVKTRTDGEGIAGFELNEPGLWYIRLIHMVRSEETDVDYESNWATLTFEMKPSN